MGDPALGLPTNDTVDIASGTTFNLDREAGIAGGAGAEHDPLLHRHGGLLGTLGIHQLAKCEGQLTQSFAADRRDLEDSVSASFKIGAHEVGEVAPFRHIDLIERDELGALEQWKLPLGHRVSSEFTEDDVEIADRIAAGLESGTVQHVQ